MTRLLMNLGLVITPFFVMPGFDVRDVKLTAAGILALALSLSGLQEGYLKRVNNIWFYIFLFYCLSMYIIAPNPTVTLGGMPIGNFWVWQPMYNFLVFGMMMLVIASCPMSRDDLNLTLSIMTWCGFVMACYMICQWLKLDQFFDNVGLDDIGRIAGVIGNPTHASPFLGMLIPIALYLRRYFFAAVMLLSVYLTHSQVAMGATILGLAAYVGFQDRRFFLTVALLAAIIISGYSVLLNHNYDKYRRIFDDNQRLMVVEQVVSDLTKPPFVDNPTRYPMTGWGMGCFKHTFHFAHYDNETFMRFHQAHNEYLELLYNTGIVGLILFLTMLFKLFRDRIKKLWRYGLSDVEIALLSGFVVICVTAAGTFIWQIGTTAYYTAIFVGLLHNVAIEE